MFNLVPVDDDPGGPRLISRRTLLKGLGLAGAAGAAVGLKAISAIGTAPPRAVVRQAPGYQPWLWSDPRAWADGRVPGPADHAVVTRPMLVEGTVAVGAVTIEATGALVFSPHTPTRLESAGNVVVAGRLVMRPDGATVEHVLAFPAVDESRMVGAGMEVVDTDVGLWVIESGVLDAVGTPRAGWNRTGTDPTWRAGDDVRVAPQAKGDYTTFAPFAPGSTVPRVIHDGVTYISEAFNLTRNVRVEGSPGGRAHVMFLHAMRPQTIKHVEFRHMGPRQMTPEGSDFVLGRYGLHFHHCRDASRGSLVEGVVIRDCGSHAFVPHASHGITFRDCIAYGVNEDAFWWDPDSRDTYPANASHDTVYDHCAVFDMFVPRDGIDNRTLSGFYLGQGEGNGCRDSVVAGVRSPKNGSGFNWPADANLKPNVWAFADCISHNNAQHGIFVWQNGKTNVHFIDRFVGYRNAQRGTNHGAYGNDYSYRDCLFFDNGEAGVVHHTSGPQSFERLVVSDSPLGLWFTNHKTDHDGYVTLYRDGRISRCSQPVRIEENDQKPILCDLVRMTVDGQDLEPVHFDLRYLHPNSRYRVQRRDGSAYEIDANGIHPIARFA